jgi:CRISPR-associated protein Cmx8
LTSDSIQGLFDDLYDAKIVETASSSKWPKATIKREETTERPDPKTGQTKQLKRFIYDVVQPQAPCLMRHLDTPEDNPWLKLWRDMVWAITRGINTTRAPFNKRADGLPCPEGPAAWEELCSFQEKLVQSRFTTSPISGALMLATQAVNAESVPFSGRTDHNFLLHFWQVVVLTYVPQVVDNDGKLEAKGYVLAIPDVADLKEFSSAFPELLATLSTERRGFRPAEALIDVPVQSTLEFLRHLRNLSAEKASRELWSVSVGAVESYQMLKAGNNIKLLAFDRVVNRPGLVREYEQIQRAFRNPLFRAARLRSLLCDQPWYAGLLELFAERPWRFFVEDEQTPKYLPRFARDARNQFVAIYKETHDMNTSEMSEIERLSRIVQRLVHRYVEGRAEAKTGKKTKEFSFEIVRDKPRRIYPADFREAQQKVCSDAFLSMRSRHDQDFVEYFVGSICSVAQFLPSSDYEFLTNTLLTKPDTSPIGPKRMSWEDVKAVAMVAVSACSYATQPRETQNPLTQGSNP